MKSLERLLNLEPSKIYPSHGKVVDDPDKHITDYINHRNSRESQIYKALEDNSDQKLTSAQLTKIVYQVSVVTLTAQVSTSDIYRRQILMFKFDPHTE